MAGKRGRPPGSKNKAKATAAGPKVHRDLTGHNSGPSDAVILNGHREVVGHEREIARQQALLKNALKRMKADGVVLADYKAARRMQAMTETEAAERHNGVRKIAKAIGVVIPQQLDIFIDMQDPDTSLSALKKRAYDKGRSDALGDKSQDRDAYDFSTEVGQAYLDGWNEGIGELNESRILSMGTPPVPTPANDVAPPPPPPAGDDDEDDDADLDDADDDLGGTGEFDDEPIRPAAAH